jgi:hypothetical protein
VGKSQLGGGTMIKVFPLGALGIGLLVTLNNIIFHVLDFSNG